MNEETSEKKLFYLEGIRGLAAFAKKYGEQHGRI